MFLSAHITHYKVHLKCIFLTCLLHWTICIQVQNESLMHAFPNMGNIILFEGIKLYSNIWTGCIRKPIKLYPHFYVLTRLVRSMSKLTYRTSPCNFFKKPGGNIRYILKFIQHANATFPTLLSNETGQTRCVWIPLCWRALRNATSWVTQRGFPCGRWQYDKRS